MGYGHSPKTPCYNMQSVVDVYSRLIIHHDVANEANDSQLLHPMSMATMEVLQVDEIRVLADGGYSNAQTVAQCERDNVEVAAPIKRGAMSTDFFRPTQFTYDDGLRHDPVPRWRDAEAIGKPRATARSDTEHPPARTAG